MVLDIDVESLTKDKEISIDSLYDDLLVVLDHRFDNGNKKEIEVHNDRYNFACPYCGDSSEDDTKKRGNLWFGRLDYKCYNCDIWKTLPNFLKDMKYQKYLDSSYIIPKIDASRYQSYNLATSNLSDIYEFGELSDKYGIERNKIRSKFNLRDIDESIKLCKYLEDRGLVPDKTYMYSPYNDNIFILNIDKKSNKVISFQIRTWEKDKKYLTIKLNKIYDKFGMEYSKEDEEWRFIDTMSKFFNFTNVDISKKIRVVEGSLDSKLLPNCFALCGLSATAPINNKNVYHIMDFDTPGRAKARGYIQEKKNTFLWKKFLNENRIKHDDSDKLDITDLFLRGVNLKLMEGYYSNQPLDSIWI